MEHPIKPCVPSTLYAQKCERDARALCPDEKLMKETLAAKFGGVDKIASVSGTAFKDIKSQLDEPELAWLRVLRRRLKSQKYAQKTKGNKKKTRELLERQCAILTKENELLRGVICTLQAKNKKKEEEEGAAAV